ncbi:hypothetical protein BpHYR1_043374 [Brachionus plicatilis]|uniref:Uncharacterized protein n=1 Tax=Brachionus plicatilis TaxID=10195 RepID=A0A3M7RHZ7_BRAPC|nr:hypothetical protein BpHYR1_043374 [Brachionus plicatilis]
MLLSFKSKFEASQLLENSDKFYSTIQKSHQSSQLIQDLSRILSILTFDEKITEYEPEVYRYETNWPTVWQFGDDFVPKSQQLLKTIGSCLDQIDDVLKTTGEICTNFSSIVLKDDLIKYKSIFEKIKSGIKSILNCIKGVEHINEKLSNFYSIIQNFSRKEKIDFFQASEFLVQNATTLSKIYLNLYTESKASNKDCNLLRLDLDIPIDPWITMKLLTVDRFNQVLKESKIKSAPLITDSESRQISAENLFFLEVVDDVDEQNEQSLIIENVYLSNACYDLMTKSFVSSNRKMLSKIPLVKITPIIDMTHIAQDAFKQVPFIDQNGDIICMFGIKFWHCTNSSLSSTLSQERNVEKSNSPNKLNQSTPISKFITKGNNKNFLDGFGCSNQIFDLFQIKANTSLQNVKIYLIEAHSKEDENNVVHLDKKVTDQTEPNSDKKQKLKNKIIRN